MESAGSQIEKVKIWLIIALLGMLGVTGQIIRRDYERRMDEMKCDIKEIKADLKSIRITQTSPN